MAKDVCINDSVTLHGHRTTVIDFAEYDGIDYVKLSDRGILVPITAIWRERNGDLTIS
jgi:hypothetical protein